MHCSEKFYEEFIGYKIDDNKIKSLCIMLPKMSDYVKGLNSKTEWLYISIEHYELLKK